MTSLPAAARGPGIAGIPLGRSFVSPLFDLAVIGGGLTLPVVAWLLWDGRSAEEFIGLSLPALVLLVTQAHFAASTVRLYTRPGAFGSFPFLTMAFPIVTLAVVSVFVMFADRIGWHLWALYLTWSPFHYAAQTFGLSSMYCMRSGCVLGEGERRLLRASCLMPFFYAFLVATGSGQGLGWFVPSHVVMSHDASRLAFEIGLHATRIATFALPALLFGWVWLRGRSSDPARPGRPAMPLISVMLILTNGLWWVLFGYLDAFIWVAVFHGLQYLGIVSVFHVREQTTAEGNRHGPLFHLVALYAMCVGLGYLLFQCWPRAYMALGFGHTQSILLVAAAINVHHFIVDAFIWRVRRDRANRDVVSSGAAPAQAAYSR